MMSVSAMSARHAVRVDNLLSNAVICLPDDDATLQGRMCTVMKKHGHADLKL